MLVFMVKKKKNFDEFMTATAVIGNLWSSSIALELLSVKNVSS
jgi:hypothetical protein